MNPPTTPSKKEAAAMALLCALPHLKNSRGFYITVASREESEACDELDSLIIQADRLQRRLAAGTAIEEKPK